MANEREYKNHAENFRRVVGFVKVAIRAAARAGYIISDAGAIYALPEARLDTALQPEISLIIPAFQEELRIANTIAALSAYLDRHHPGSEMIVVCDGCTDKTAALARNSFTGTDCTLKVIELFPNRGKCGAVKEGMMAAQGALLFFTDADLAFAPETIEPFYQALLAGADVVIAQRRKETTYPGLGRKLVAVLSRWLIGNWVLPGIRDTQAGFKAFTRHAARFLFSRARISRFLFDLEILVMARKKGFRIEKVYVDWKDCPGSTVRLFMDSSRAARDLVRILCCSAFGCYKLDEADGADEPDGAPSKQQAPDLRSR